VQRSARETLARIQKVLGQDPSNGSALGFGACSLAALGDGERTKEWIGRALLMDPDNLTMRWNLVCALSRYLGDKDAAIELLASFAERIPPPMVKYLRLDTDLDPLRGDPRFEEMVAREERRVAASHAVQQEAMMPMPQSVG
jgi:adenylate cyclase